MAQKVFEGVQNHVLSLLHKCDFGPEFYSESKVRRLSYNKRNDQNCGDWESNWYFGPKISTPRISWHGYKWRTGSCNLRTWTIEHCRTVFEWLQKWADRVPLVHALVPCWWYSQHMFKSSWIDNFFIWVTDKRNRKTNSDLSQFIMTVKPQTNRIIWILVFFGTFINDWKSDISELALKRVFWLRQTCREPP